MKIIQAIIRDKVKEIPTAMLSADKGHELSFEGGVLHVRCEQGYWLIPASNVMSMRAEDTPKKK